MKFKVEPACIVIDEIDKKKAYIVIWTTTPWTLPANLAVCFHPEFQYSLFRFKDEFYILAKGLVQQMESVLGMEHQGEWPLDPAQIEALRVAHPFIDRDSK